MQLMAELARALGKDDEADGFEAQVATSYKAFQQTFFDADKGLYRDGMDTDHTSLHANLFPLAFGWVPKASRSAIADWLANRGMACSVYAAQYLMEALFENGADLQAVELITAKSDRSWRHMVESGTTITWEAWDQKYKPNQDWNHAWGAAPANLLPRYILGAQALTPGWETARIQPHLGGLKFAEGKVPTPKGPILIKLENVPNKPFRLDVSVPANMKAQVEIPLPDGKGGITLNGESIQAEVINGYAVVEDLGCGMHQFLIPAVVKERIKPKAPVVEVIKAVYGSDEKNVDVTVKFRSLVIPDRQAVNLPCGYNKQFGDPHPKTVKKLVVEYEPDGKKKCKTFAEDCRVVLD